jgi:hypothetical protein
MQDSTALHLDSNIARAPDGCCTHSYSLKIPSAVSMQLVTKVVCGSSKHMFCLAPGLCCCHLLLIFVPLVLFALCVGYCNCCGPRW